MRLLILLATLNKIIRLINYKKRCNSYRTLYLCIYDITMYYMHQLSSFGIGYSCVNAPISLVHDFEFIGVTHTKPSNEENNCY